MFTTPEQWEAKYFDGIDTRGVTIPVDDVTAFQHFKNKNWVYNKIALMHSQHIDAYPHGVIPTSFPVFSKPITNLWGLGLGAKILREWNPDTDYIPGHFWMPYLSGEHFSVDVVVKDGMVLWTATAEGNTNDVVPFTHWKITPETPPAVLATIEEWVCLHLSKHTGVVNFEIIGNTIIECHLRMSCQWVVFYGKEWLKEVVNLYANGQWSHPLSARAGYSLPLWKWQPGIYTISNGWEGKIQHLDVDIQIINEGEPSSTKWGKTVTRVAVVNCSDLNRCEQAAEILHPLITRTHN